MLEAASLGAFVNIDGIVKSAKLQDILIHNLCQEVNICL